MQKSGGIMGHRTVRSGYQELTRRLNRFPQGAPPSEYLLKILSVLMREQEASILSLMPVKPFTAADAARALRKPIDDTAKRLDELAERALLVDVLNPDGEMVYMLPPPMAGFFEFSLMRVRNDLDQKVLSELFYQYLNVEEEFIRDLFVAGETKMARVLVNEQAVPQLEELYILDYERSSHLIQNASAHAVGMCYCRHKMEHLGKACAAPMDICLTLGNVAASLVRHGHAREIDEKEAMSLIDTAYTHNLVQIAENQQEQIPFICNCCGCCCEALLAVKRFGTLHAISTTNFLPVISEASCTACGACVSVCPVDAIMQKGGTVSIDTEACLGCGICVHACTNGSLELTRREKRVITPVNSVHRVVLMAIERGKLQHLIFDNQALLSHRAMAALFGAILKLPPARQILASNQVQSKYLVSLIKSYGKPS